MGLKTRVEEGGQGKKTNRGQDRQLKEREGTKRFWRPLIAEEMQKENE